MRCLVNSEESKERMVQLPTSTFFNLPETKRKRIIDAATNEFSKYALASASIARIVEQAEIPRGSFYQYFTDIKDLYKYILDLIAEKKLHYINDVMAELGGEDVLSVIRILYTAGVQFAKENTELAHIGSRFLKENHDLKREILSGLEGQSHNVFEDLIQTGQMQGEIDPSVDAKVASLMFFSLNIGLIDYLLAQAANTDLLGELDTFLEIVDKMLYIIENGIRV